MEPETITPKANDNIEVPFSYALRRYLARSFDALISIVVISFLMTTFLFGLLSSPNIQERFSKLILANHDTVQKILGPIGDIILSVILCILFMPIISAIMYYFGNTPGKAMFGIKVKNIDNSPLTFKKLLHREANVWFWGHAMGIPFFALIANIIAYFNLTKQHVTNWDKELHTEVVYTKMTWLNWILAIITIMLINLLIAHFALKNFVVYK